MTLARQQAALFKRLEQRAAAQISDDGGVILNFFDASADVLTANGIIRGKTAITAAAASDDVDPKFFKGLRNGEVASVKWLSNDVALVDTVLETDNGKEWSHDVWYLKDGAQDYNIRLSRTRAGVPTPFFTALNALASDVVTDDVPSTVPLEDRETLRKSFKDFRTAWNTGDTSAMGELWENDADGIAVFGFLQGRAQIGTGRAAAKEKMARMSASTFVAGEPKVIRFLSPTLAAVDGTAEIKGIPAAHGFAPKEMKGVYTDFWRKSGGRWQLASTRPNF